MITYYNPAAFAGFFSKPISLHIQHNITFPDLRRKDYRPTIRRVLAGLLVGSLLVVLSTVSYRGAGLRVVFYALETKVASRGESLVTTASGGAVVDPTLADSGALRSLGDMMRTGEGWVYITYTHTSAPIGIGRPLLTFDRYTPEITPWDGGVTNANNHEATHRSRALAAGVFAKSNEYAAAAVQTHTPAVVHAISWFGVFTHGLLMFGLIVIGVHVWLAPRAVRGYVAASRVRRGLCRKCGYVVGTAAVCPECGESAST